MEVQFKLGDRVKLKHNIDYDQALKFGDIGTIVNNCIFYYFVSIVWDCNKYSGYVYHRDKVVKI